MTVSELIKGASQDIETFFEKLYDRLELRIDTLFDLIEQKLEDDEQ